VSNCSGSAFTLFENQIQFVAHNGAFCFSSIAFRPAELATNIAETKDANSGSKGSNETERQELFNLIN